MGRTEELARTVRTYFASYPSRNRAAIEALVADAFHFTSPRDNRIDRRTYFAHCWPNSEKTRAITITHLVVEDTRAFVTYEAEMRDSHRFRNAGVLTVQDGQILDVEVYFGWSLPHAAPDGTFIEGEKG